MHSIITILLTKTTAAQNEVALSYHNVRGLCFQAVVFEATIVCIPHIPSLRLLRNFRLYNTLFKLTLLLSKVLPRVPIK